MTDFVSVRGAFFPVNQIKQITQHREDNTNTFRVETQEYLVEEAVPPTQFTVIPNQHQHLHLAEFSWVGKQCETELFPILAWRVKVNLFPYSDGREEYGVGEPITVDAGIDKDDPHFYAVIYNATTDRYLCGGRWLNKQAAVEYALDRRDEYVDQMIEWQQLEKKRKRDAEPQQLPSS